jgi:hypothetical protein
MKLMRHHTWGCWLLLLPLLAGGTVVAADDAAQTGFDPRRFFESTVLVTDKGEYVHIFWDAQAAAKELDGPQRRGRLVAAAAQLVLDRFPGSAASDIAKIDIVFVKAKDDYGKPKWDSLQKVAHFELHATRIKEKAQVSAGRVTAVPEEAFDRIDVFQ